MSKNLGSLQPKEKVLDWVDWLLVIIENVSLVKNQREAILYPTEILDYNSLKTIQQPNLGRSCSPKHLEDAKLQNLKLRYLFKGNLQLNLRSNPINPIK